MKELIEAGEDLSTELNYFEEVMGKSNIDYPKKLDMAWGRLTELIQQYYEAEKSE